MNIKNVCWLILFISSQAFSFEASNTYLQKSGELYVKSLSLLIKAEKNQDQKIVSYFSPIINLLGIPSACADAPERCLISGWIGEWKGNSCKPVTGPYGDAKKACIEKSGSQKSVPCNPEVFPGPICISPESSRWTIQCEKNFLTSFGITKPMESLDRKDYESIGKQLIKNKININTVSFKATSVCNAIRDYKLDRKDCRSVTELFRNVVKDSSRFERKMMFSAQTKLGKIKDKPSTNQLLKPKDNCSTVENFKSDDPVYHQGTTGSCYAFAATEIMNYKNPSKSISPYATALQHDEFVGMENKQNMESNNPLYHIIGFEGGSVANAIKAANNYGPCSNDRVGSGKNYQEYYLHLKKIYEDYNKEKSSPDCNLELLVKIENKAISEILKLEGKLGRWLASVKEKNDESIIIKEYEHDLIDILKNSVSVDNFLYNVVDYSCRTHEKEESQMSPPWGMDFEDISIDETPEKEQMAIDMIHETLESGYIQSIAYYTENLISTPEKGEHGAHASVVVGRKELTDSKILGSKPPGCYFLVKNSWGKDWPGENGLKDKKALADPTLKGYFWVSEQDLSNNLRKVTKVETTK